MNSIAEAPVKRRMPDGAGSRCQQPGCTAPTQESTATLCSQHGHRVCCFKGCGLPTHQLRAHYCPVHHGQKELLPRPQQPAAAQSSSSGANGGTVTAGSRASDSTQPATGEELDSEAMLSKMGTCWLPRRRPDWWWLGLHAPEYGTTECSAGGPAGTAPLVPPPAAHAVPAALTADGPQSLWNPFTVWPPPMWPLAPPPPHQQASSTCLASTSAPLAAPAPPTAPHAGLIAPLAVHGSVHAPAVCTMQRQRSGGPHNRASHSLDFPVLHPRSSLEAAAVASVPPNPPPGHSFDGLPPYLMHLPPPHHHGHHRRHSYDTSQHGIGSRLFQPHPTPPVLPPPQSTQSGSPPTVESVSESEQAGHGLSDTASAGDPSGVGDASAAAARARLLRIAGDVRLHSSGGTGPTPMLGVGRHFSSPCGPMYGEMAGSWEDDIKYGGSSSGFNTVRASVDESSPPECKPTNRRQSKELVKPVAHKPVAVPARAPPPPPPCQPPDSASPTTTGMDEPGGGAVTLCQFAGCCKRAWIGGTTPRSSLEGGGSKGGVWAVKTEGWTSLPRKAGALVAGGGRSGANAFRPLAPKRGEAAAASVCVDHLGAKPCAHEDCAKVAWGATLFCAEHREAKRCEFEGCTVHLKYSKRRRFCKAHTPTHCLHAGCTKRRQDDSGYCFAHGGGKRCAFAGCVRGVCKMGNTLFCIAHGGGLRCQHEGCKFSDRGHTGLCRMHGGGKRCQWEGCNKSAVGGTLHCVAHGGGLRCQHEGCDRCVAARGNRKFCVPHGGGIRCHHEGCTKVTARGSKQFCVEHGGGHRCKHTGCKRLAAYPTEFCKGHGGGSRCQHEGCTKSAQSLAPMLCAAHGGGKRCESLGCTKSAARVGNKLFCAKHGGGHRCQFENCEKSAWTSARLCRTHAVAKRAGMGGGAGGPASVSPSSSCSVVHSGSEASVA